MGDTPQSNLRGLFRVAAASTAIGFGSVAGSLYSLRQGPSGMIFVFSVGSVVAFILGAAAGWFYWRVLNRIIVGPERDGVGRRRKVSQLVLLNIGAGLFGLLAFLYPIRFVRPERMRDVLEGMGAAFFVLALVGVALWRVIRFLNQDSDTNRSE